MSITKADTISMLANHLGCTVNKATEITESLLEIIKSTLESGEDVSIRGFGRFCVKEKKERRGNNLVTGGVIFFRARKVVTFKCSRTLRDKINNG
jgi:integration host factor subunit alpha